MLWSLSFIVHILDLDCWHFSGTLDIFLYYSFGSLDHLMCTVIAVSFLRLHSLCISLGFGMCCFHCHWILGTFSILSWFLLVFIDYSVTYYLTFVCFCSFCGLFSCKISSVIPVWPTVYKGLFQIFCIYLWMFYILTHSLLWKKFYVLLRKMCTLLLDEDSIDTC